MTKTKISCSEQKHTLIGQLHYWSTLQEQVALVHHLPDGSEKPVTYQSLYHQVLCIADSLAQRYQPGERLMLLMRDNEQFFLSFLGCMAAGIVPVPCNCPREGAKHWHRLSSIIRDSGVSGIIGLAGYLESMNEWIQQQDFADLAIDMVSVEQLLAHQTPYETPRLTLEDHQQDLAFLQYTSGSTGDPKGVMVTHKNLVHNMQLIAVAGRVEFDFEKLSPSCLITWLPLFHDMGLISVLSHLYSGAKTVIMLPSTFIRNPMSWLQVATKHKATWMGAPNFAYDLCLAVIKPEMLQDIDLSTIKLLFNGAEPISSVTAERFLKRFACTGITPDVFSPCYGMAEVTLVATIAHNRPRFVLLDEHGEVTRIEKAQQGAHVSSGPIDGFLRTRIVNPETLQLCRDGEEGEIWVSGDSVSAGYWNKPEVNAKTFGVSPVDESGYEYVRTGDMGFTYENDLFVTGRIKDVIIIRGRNYYPHDIERETFTAHRALYPTGAAAFGVEKNNQEALVVVCEMVRDAIGVVDLEEVKQAVRRQILEAFELAVSDVVVILPTTLAKTTSGKIQRSRNKAMYLAGKLARVETLLAEQQGDSAQPAAAEKAPEKPAKVDVEAMLFSAIVEVLHCERSSLNTETSLLALGLDSLSAGLLSAAIERELGVVLDSYDVIDSQSIGDLIARVSKQLNAAANDEPAVQNSRGLADASITSPFQLTSMQQAYFVGQQDIFDLGGTSLHTYMEIDGDLDIEGLMAAWNRLIAAHPMLRAVLTNDGRQQTLARVAEYVAPQEDFRHLSADMRDMQLGLIREEMAQQSFDLTNWPFFDIRFSRIDETNTRLHLSVDGIFLDFRSFQIIFHQWLGLYRQRLSAVDTPAVNFAQYVEWLASQTTTERYQASLSYWQQKVSDLPKPPQLPMATRSGFLAESNTQTDQKHAVTRRKLALDNAQLARLTERSQAAGLTRASVMLAVFADAVARWSDEPTFTLNVPIFNRPADIPESNDVLGNFSSFVLVAVDYSTPQSFAQRAQAIQQEMHNGMRHSQVSGIDVVRMLTSESGQSLDGGFPVVFTHLPHGIEEWDRSTLGDIQRDLGDMVYSITQTPQVWLDNQIWYTESGVTIHLDSVDDMFPPHVAEAMFDVYQQQLLALTAEENIWSQVAPLYNLPATALPTDTELQTDTDLLAAPHIVESFIACVERTPDAVAVVCDGQSLTYAELQQQAAILASHLRDQGVQPNDKVAIGVEKSIAQIVSVFAALFCGAAYVPLDTDMPIARMAHVLTNSEAKALLTQGNLVSRFAQSPALNNLAVIAVDEVDFAATAVSAIAPVIADNSALAMLIYTSGTTGMPKGVMVQYSAVNHAIAWANKAWKVEGNCAFLAVTNLFHDLATYDMFGPLSVGGKVVLPTAEQRRDPSVWHQLMQQQQVTLFNGVPSAFEMYADFLAGSAQQAATSLQTVAVGGDVVSVDFVRKVQNVAQNVALFSYGGPTETTIFNVFYPITLAADNYARIPYGRANPNNRYRIVNNEGLSCPCYVAGEMICEGVQVTQGYANNPEAMERAFFTSENGEWSYRTGDMGYYLPDGEIIIIGRRDHQVKIRGYRVETAEIEATLNREMPAVSRSVAQVLNSGGDAHAELCLFYSTGNDEGADSTKRNDANANHGVNMSQRMAEHTGEVEQDVRLRTAFKVEQRNIRQDLPVEHSLTGKADVDTADVLRRQSIRSFTREPLSQDAFGKWLASAAQYSLESSFLPKYRYPSGGGLYPVQMYLYLKQGAVADLAQGFYYYNPQTHGLAPLSKTDEIRVSDFIETVQPIAESAGFYLFMVLDKAAIAPLYGELSEKFGLLEAGYLSQLLMTQASDNNVGLCPVGYFEQSLLQSPLCLTEQHLLVHTLLGGHIAPEQLTDWLSEEGGAANTAADSELENAMKETLHAHLPSYMVPTRFIPVAEFPLTLNGKVDRSALIKQAQQSLGASGAAVEVVSAENETQSALLALWKTFLKRDDIGIEHSFFEVGGNSVLMVNLHAQLTKTLNIDVPVATLFKYSTIRSLSEFLEGQQQGNSGAKSSGRGAKQREAMRRQRNQRR